MQGDVRVEESWSVAQMYMCVYVHACAVDHVLEEAVSLEGQTVTGDGRCQSGEAAGGYTMRSLDLPRWGTVEDLWSLGGPVTEDMENMPGKLLGARVSSGGSGENKAQLVKNRKLY